MVTLSMTLTLRDVVKVMSRLL